MKWFQKFASNSETNNYSATARAKRLNLFLSKISQIDKTKIRVIDLGGTTNFWEVLKKIIHINFEPLLVNLDVNAVKKYNGVCGRAEELNYIKDNSFDVCFSNSMIEHLRSFEEQKRMAAEITRISNVYFIQTPAFIFPLEPHFLFPFFHWLPKSFQIKLIRHFNLGWYKKTADYAEAENLVYSIRILKKRELRKLFPNGNIITERFFFIPKAYVATNL